MRAEGPGGMPNATEQGWHAAGAELMSLVLVRFVVHIGADHPRRKVGVLLVLGVYLGGRRGPHGASAEPDVLEVEWRPCAFWHERAFTRRPSFISHLPLSEDGLSAIGVGDTLYSRAADFKSASLSLEKTTYYTQPLCGAHCETRATPPDVRTTALSAADTIRRPNTIASRQGNAAMGCLRTIPWHLSPIALQHAHASTTHGIVTSSTHTHTNTMTHTHARTHKTSHTPLIHAQTHGSFHSSITTR